MCVCPLSVFPATVIVIAPVGEEIGYLVVMDSLEAVVDVDVDVNFLSYHLCHTHVSAIDDKERILHGGKIEIR